MHWGCALPTGSGPQQQQQGRSQPPPEGPARPCPRGPPFGAPVLPSEAICSLGWGVLAVTLGRGTQTLGDRGEGAFACLSHSGRLGVHTSPAVSWGGTTHSVPLWARVSPHGEAGSWRLVLDRAESAGHPHGAPHGG